MSENASPSANDSRARPRATVRASRVFTTWRSWAAAPPGWAWHWMLRNAASPSCWSTPTIRARHLVALDKAAPRRRSRYLAQGNIGLVREALHERTTVLHIAPGLAHPLAFVIPAIRWWERAFYGAGLRYMTGWPAAPGWADPHPAAPPNPAAFADRPRRRPARRRPVLGRTV
jgi:hypothetical protein